MIVCDKLDSGIATKVIEERKRQYNKWGDQRHAHKDWWWILQEELAEAKCKIELGYGIEEVKKELIQCSAVLQAWIRNIILNYKKGKGEEAFRGNENEKGT